MTCEHTECSRNAVGTVKWKSQAGTLEREYCPKHLRDTKAMYPQSVEEVVLE